MKNKFKNSIIFLIIIFTLSLVGLLFGSPASAQTDCANVSVSPGGGTQASEIQKIICSPQPRIKIPGLSFTSPEEMAARYVREEEDGTYIYVPFLGEYIAAGYKYAVGAAAIIALVMIIISGLQWMLPGNVITSILTKAGGEKQEEQTNKAKKRISGALIGLLLILGSYTVLYTVNPDLVEFKNLRVKYIGGIALSWNEGNESVQNDQQEIPEFAAGATPINVTPGTLNYNFNNVPYYAQGDSRWGSISYGNNTDCTTYRESACGPASIAMVLSHIGIVNDEGSLINPVDVGEIAVSSGARSCPPSDGTEMSSAFREAIEEEFNVSAEIVNDVDSAIQLLRNDHPLVQGGPHAGFTNNNELKTYDGHYIVFTGIDTINGQEVVRVNDSGRMRADEGIVYIPIELFRESGRSFLYIHIN